MKTPDASQAGQQGFSLLEVLVAFAILSISMGVIFQSYSTGVRGITLSEEYSKAAALAESQLLQVGTAIPLEQGVIEGVVDEKYNWSLSINPADGVVSQESSLIPYKVDVKVSWTEGRGERSVDLSTLKLARREP